MAAIASAHCPNCTGPLPAGAASCPYCGSTVAVRTTMLRVTEESVSRGDVTKRLQELRARVARNPDDVEGQYELGVLYRHLGLYDEAVAALGTAVALTPENPSLQFDLGKAHHLQAGIGDAAADAKASQRLATALRIDPHNADALALSAARSLAKRQGDTAIGYLDRLAEVDEALARPVLRDYLSEDVPRTLALPALHDSIERVRRRKEAEESENEALLWSVVLIAVAVAGYWYVSNHGGVLQSVNDLTSGPFKNLGKPALSLLVGIVAAVGYLFNRSERAKRLATSTTDLTALERRVLDGTHDDLHSLIRLAGQAAGATGPGVTPEELRAGMSAADDLFAHGGELTRGSRIGRFAQRTSDGMDKAPRHFGGGNASSEVVRTKPVREPTPARPGPGGTP